MNGDSRDYADALRYNAHAFDMATFHGRHLCAEPFKRKEPKDTGNRFVPVEERDYTWFWYNTAGIAIYWSKVDDRYLANIIRFTRHWAHHRDSWRRAAYNGSHEEHDRRHRRRTTLQETQRLVSENGVELPKRPFIENKIDDVLVDVGLKILGEFMGNKSSSNAAEVIERAHVADSELPKYFNRKVKFLDTPARGVVVGIYSEQYPHNAHERHAQLRVKLDGSDRTQMVNASDVELIDVLTIFAYQAKDGSIEWSSKSFPAATLKRKGWKKIENATKYVDLN